MNFSTYASSRRNVSDFIERITGESPLEHYYKPGSHPTVSTVLTFTMAGFCAGAITSPLACRFSGKTISMHPQID